MPAAIEDYALIGNMRTAGLVSRTGSIDWLCVPRFDSHACLAGLLGSDDNGQWSLAPAAGGRATSRRYRPDTLVLETEWRTPEGTVRVLDFMPVPARATEVVRIVEGVSGRVPMRSQLRLRFDFGLIDPLVRELDGHLVGIAGPDSTWLRGDAPHHEEGSFSCAEFTVSAGQRLSFVLTWQPSHLPAPAEVDACRALAATDEFWRDWAAGARCDSEWREPVVRSLITLKALTFAPTGGIVAAATTSLPEDIGGERNWDY